MSSERYDKLLKVYNKTIDSSCNSVNDQDLLECCGQTIKSNYGNNLQKLFLNHVIANVTNKLQESFQNICDKYSLEEKLQLLDNYKPNNNTLESAEEMFITNPTLSKVILDLKKVEGEELLSSIRYLESDLDRLNELAGRLRAQVTNELNAVAEEKQKIITVVNHCNINNNNS